MSAQDLSMAFESFALEWLATWAIVKLKASGYREYEGIVRRHLIPELGESLLVDISPQQIQSFVARKIAVGLSPRTVGNHIIVLKRVLETAVDYGLLAENPVDKVAMPRIERSEMSFLLPSELSQLIEATSPPWKLLLALPAFIGLRKGEVLALQWSDIDLDAMTISISRSMRGGIVTTPKTRGSIATLPLPELVSSLMADRRRQAGGHKLIFCKSDGSPLSDATPNRILSRSLVRAGLPSIRFHDLRHSFVVAHLSAGTDIKTLASLGRWASTSVLLETYAHVLPTMGGDAVRRLDRLIND